MSYQIGEAAALTLIQGLSAWDGNNSISLANDAGNIGGILVNSGKSDKYCILHPGQFESGYENVGETLVINRWQTLITIIVFANPKSKVSPEKELTELRQAIMNTLDARFELNSSSVSSAKVVSGGEIINDTTQNLGPFISQELTLQWEELSEVLQAD